MQSEEVDTRSGDAWVWSTCEMSALTSANDLLHCGHTSRPVLVATP